MLSTRLSQWGLIAVLAITGCTEQPHSSSSVDAEPESAFVFATAPSPGESVYSGFSVQGRSRTFESNVCWKLFAHDGSLLSSGHTSGGGVNGSKSFSFAVDYKVTESQIAHLEVYEEDASDGEGFPPPRTVIPLILLN